MQARLRNALDDVHYLSRPFEAAFFIERLRFGDAVAHVAILQAPGIDRSLVATHTVIAFGAATFETVNALIT